MSLWILVLAALAGLQAAAQTKTAQAKAAASVSAPSGANPLLSKVESYLRILFAWGPGYKVTVGPAKPSPIPDLEEVPVQVSYQGHTNNGTVYVTKDGRFLVRGEIRNMNEDPYAANRAKLKTSDAPSDAPSRGPADARVTVVEFSDFECPHCRELYEVLKQVEPEFPQVRFVYKNFPLTEIHPWAMSAALAGRCAFQISPQDFWKLYGDIFANQDNITADNAWDTFTTFATAAGMNADALHACMSNPATKKAVEADIAEGKSLGMDSTPTFFINGRPLVGGDKQSLEEMIRFELAHSTHTPR